MTNKFQVAKPTTKLGLKASVAVALLTVIAPAFAADTTAAITYPTIDFSSIPFAVWIAAVMAFAIMAGMAYIGLSALISVLRKSRGAVR